MPRLESAGDSPGTADAPGLNRLGEALELADAEALDLKVSAGEFMRQRCDYDRVRLGDFLHPRRQNDRFADDRRMIENGLIDRHHAGGNADPDPERLAAPFSRLSNRLNDAQRRAHSAFGLIAMGFRIAEENQRAVAAHFGDMPLERCDRGAAAGRKVADRVVILFRIERIRELGRVDQIAEQRRELPALAAQRHLGGALAGSQLGAALTTEVGGNTVLGAALGADHGVDAASVRRLRGGSIAQ